MNPSAPLKRAELIALRRDIHHHPELGFKEERTCALVEKHLSQLGLKPRVMAGTGVTALVMERVNARFFLARHEEAEHRSQSRRWRVRA
jgi:metal-dependent amidase/aminoacylase/carboxypeptidase family protein